MLNNAEICANEATRVSPRRAWITNNARQALDSRTCRDIADFMIFANRLGRLLKVVRDAACYRLLATAFSPAVEISSAPAA
jgi:hypothetical protein